jgi:acyl-CoA thioesterase
MMGVDNYADVTGLEVLAAEAGYAKVRLPVSDTIVNGHGNVHGGAYFTLADYTAAIASNMYGTPTVAVNGTISFLSPVREGCLVAEARTVKSGRRMKFMTVEIRDAGGRLVAVFQGSSATVERTIHNSQCEMRSS